MGCSSRILGGSGPDFELATEDYLFDPRAGTLGQRGGWTADEDHLALCMDLLRAGCGCERDAATEACIAASAMHAAASAMRRMQKRVPQYMTVSPFATVALLAALNDHRIALLIVHIIHLCG